MRVVIVTRFPEAPARPRGGVESVSVNLVRALAELDGMDVAVVTTAPNVGALSKTEWCGAEIHRLPWAGGKMLWHAVGPGRRQIREYVPALKPDVVHAHDTFGLAVKGLAVPRVFTVHGFIHADTLLAGGRLPRLRSWLWRMLETRGWADQPHIISITPYVRTRLEEIVRTSTIHDIDNPVPQAFYDVPRHERPGTILCAAHLSPGKNTLGLVDAFAALRARGVEAELRLAGGARDEAFRLRVVQRIEEKGLADRVKLLGQLAPPALMRELGSAAVFALVSFQENAPMAIQEAMAAGVPVVTSNLCGMPYMVRDGESGFLVAPGDPDEIAARLRQVIEDDSLRASMSAVSRRIAQDRFHADRVAARTREVYRQAIREFQESRCA